MFYLCHAVIYQAIQGMALAVVLGRGYQFSFTCGPLTRQVRGLARMVSW